MLPQNQKPTYRKPQKRIYINAHFCGNACMVVVAVIAVLFAVNIAV